MKEKELRKLVIELIAEQTGKKVEEINLLDNLKEDLWFDSLDSLENLIRLESELEVEIYGELEKKLFSCKTVEEVINFVIAEFGE